MTEEEEVRWRNGRRAYETFRGHEAETNKRYKGRHYRPWEQLSEVSKQRWIHWAKDVASPLPPREDEKRAMDKAE